ncbi:unnamed protein product [Meganyctiphanes norvegica]|uniref:Uncharacterized protein n=1 Tax=Meganyctiphanes norvegica TaxID=48144 RepID=A0AAV2PIA5_MEGNR
MCFVLYVLGLALYGVVVHGVQDKSSRENEGSVYYDLDHGSDSFIFNSDNLTDDRTTTTKPKHHIHPLEMTSDLNIQDLCNCFSKLEVSKDCRQRYPDNLRTLRNGSIQMAYLTDDKSVVSSKSLPLIIVSSGQQENLHVANESLVLVCGKSLGAPLKFAVFHHISRLHMTGQILQDRINPVGLTFSSISGPLRLPTGSLLVQPPLPTAPPGEAEPITAAAPMASDTHEKLARPKHGLILQFKECSSVVLESNSIETPELILIAEHVDFLKLYPESIAFTYLSPFFVFHVFYSRMLTMQKNAIIFGNLNPSTETTETCDQYHREIELRGIQQVILAQNALKLPSCTNLTLRTIYLAHAGLTALTNLHGAILDTVLVTHVQGNGDLVPGAICVIANSVKVAENQLYTHQLYKDEGDVIWLGGVKSVNVEQDSSVGVQACQQQNLDVVGLQGCQVCQRNNASNSSTPPQLLLRDSVHNPTTGSSTESNVMKQVIQGKLQDPTRTEEDTSFDIMKNKMLLLYLVVAAAILVLTIIAAFVIHAINRRKKRMSWKVPSLPWAKSHYNSRHPALAAKAAYRASRECSGKPECYTIFDSIAAAKQVQLPPSPKQTKEKLPTERKQAKDEKHQDQQECTYSEPADSLTSTRLDNNIYANPSIIKGGSLERSTFNDRRLSACTASVASSIADLSVISALSTQDRRKSSFGLLIDITSVLGIESNYKQLTNQ